MNWIQVIIKRLLATLVISFQDHDYHPRPKHILRFSSFYLSSRVIFIGKYFRLRNSIGIEIKLYFPIIYNFPSFKFMEFLQLAFFHFVPQSHLSFHRISLSTPKSYPSISNFFLGIFNDKKDDKKRKEKSTLRSLQERESCSNKFHLRI